MITQLINAPDNFEVVRDRIADILSAESASQQVLALAADPPLDPKLWELQVYTERVVPWAQWLDAPDPQSEEDPSSNTAPIINVSFDQDQFEQRSSSTVSGQKTTANFNIDCFGYAISMENPAGGHFPGDQAAAFEAQRAARLVRQILMAGTYTYLGFPREKTNPGAQIVWRRWLDTRKQLSIGTKEQPVSDVSCVRLVLQVEFLENSPQVEGVPIQSIGLTFKRQTGTPDGQVIAQIEIPGDNG